MVDPVIEFEEFLDEKRLDRVTEGTIRWYRTYVGPWVAWDRSGGERAALVAYLERYRSGETAKTALNAVAIFERWRGSTWLDRRWAARLRRSFGDAQPQRMMTPAELERLLAAAPATAAHARNVAMIALAGYSSLRRGAVGALRVEDLDCELRTVRVRTKGGRRAIVPYGSEAAPWLERWLALRAAAPALARSPWLFPSTRRPERAVAVSHVSHVLPRYAMAAGIQKRVWFHGLRHFCLSSLARGKAPVPVIRAQALHKDIRSTMKYLHADLEDQRAELARAFG